MRRDTWFLLAAIALIGIGALPAQDTQVPQAPDQQAPPDTTKGVARISLINGEVNVRRGDSGDWVAAAANAPLMVEDHIATGATSRAEVQFDYSNFLRLGANTEAQFAQLEANRYQIQVSRGTVDFSVLRATPADIEIDTPSVSVRPRDRGNYRITVLDNGESEITVRSGRTEIYTPRGVETVSAGQTMLVRGDPTNPEFQIVAAMAQDEWDRWNADRDRRLDVAGNNVYNRYVSPDVYGAESMDGYGRWVNAPDYGGYVWAPAQSPGWAPYQNGRWVWEDYYGWTWVSYDPWGWAPYHYGRWFFSAGYGGWCWWPGSIRAHHWWAPAYVGFFGFGPGIGVGFGFGNVGWVALAPFEAFHPWWGRGFGGGGFGRTTIINNVSIYNTYRNARVMNGVTAVSAHDFGAGRFSNRMPVTANSLRGAGMVQGRLGITPGAQHLRFSDRAVTNVPRTSANQRFFSQHQATTGQRTPFAQQQRAMGGNPGAISSRPTPGTTGSYRPGNTAPTVTGGRGNGIVQSPNSAGNYRQFGTTPQRSAPVTRAPMPSTNGGTPGSTGSGSGWHRFGQPGGTAGSGSAPNGSANPNGNWGRFGSPNSGTAPRSNYSAPSGSGRIPMSPPSLRERSTPQYNAPQYRNTPQYSRPSSGGGSPAPQYNAPQYRNTPQYSRPSSGGGSPAPQYNAPQYRNTPQYSRPSSGGGSPAPHYSTPSSGGGRSYGSSGGRSSSGGGGGHSSSSHGGGHR